MTTPVRIPSVEQVQAMIDATDPVAVGPATPSAQGVVRLAGDLAGTADAPTVPGLTGLDTRLDTVEGTLAAATPAATPNTVVGRDQDANSSFNEVMLAGQTTAASAARRDFVEGARRRPTVSVLAPGRALLASDEATLLLVSSTTASTITVPLAADVPIPDGAWIDVLQFHPQPVTIVGAAGVSLFGPDGTVGPVTIRARYGTVRLIKRAGDSWWVEGDMVNAASTAATAAAPRTYVDARTGYTFGRYAQRPDPTTMASGARYYADDTREEYVAIGPAGGAATRWWAPPSNGGSEIGYAKLTIPSWTIPVGSAWQLIPGCFFAFPMPERPIWLTGQCLTRYVTTTEDAVFGVFETTGGTITQLSEDHPGQQSNAGDFGSTFTSARLSGTPGVWRSFEFRALQRAAAYTMANSTVFPAQIRGVLG